MESKEAPLTTAALHILLALSESDLHGYGILQSVKQQSEGKYRMGPGTLYANLANLLANGWVGETQRRLKGGETRREYCLTPGGEQALRIEIRRLRQIVASARRRLDKLDERDA
ncbi:MAG TPA: PadR family transcriptional regulator [Candidatus Sulfotelmatobacter sp.]|nr:PadR family transcriptional regulator [Candidatus Sulfotelmatobacter sp.]